MIADRYDIDSFADSFGQLTTKIATTENANIFLNVYFLSIENSLLSVDFLVSRDCYTL